MCCLLELLWWWNIISKNDIIYFNKMVLSNNYEQWVKTFQWIRGLERARRLGKCIGFKRLSIGTNNKIEMGPGGAVWYLLRMDTTIEAAKEVFDSSNFSATNVAREKRNLKIKSLWRNLKANMNPISSSIRFRQNALVLYTS